MKAPTFAFPVIAATFFTLSQLGSSQTLTTSYNFGSIGSPLDSGVSFNGSLNYFNTNLGTLNSVEFRLILNMVGGSGQGFSAVGAPDATMDFNSNLTVRVGATGPTLRDENFDRPELTATSVIEDVFVPGNGGNSGVQAFPGETADSGWVLVDSSFFSGFQSVGPSTFTVSNAPSAGIPGNSNFTTTGGTVETSIYTSPDYYGVIEVRYNYEAIPEPSSALLIGLASLGLVVRRRRI